MDTPLDTIGMVLGASLCGVVILQMVVSLGRRWLDHSRREDANQARKTAFSEQVRAALRRVQAQQSHVAWEGCRPFRVAAIVDEAIDIKSYYLSPADGLTLPPYEPGQYLTFHLQLPDREQPLVRCYSLSDKYRGNYYRATIKRVAAPVDRPDLPAGKASHFMHHQVKVGDLLHLQAPRGSFFLDPLVDRPIALIGGGIGLTPLVSMLNTVVSQDDQQDVYLLLSFRNSEYHPFKEQLTTISAQHSNVHLHVSYTAPLEKDRLGRDYDAEGRVTLERIRNFLPSNNLQFYICGPSRMMSSVVPDLLEWGVSDDNIYFEAFGAESVKSARFHPDAPELDQPPCEVHFGDRDTPFTWDGSHESLLEFGEAHGVTMESGCRAGNCGRCVTPIKSGKVATIKKPGIPVQSGFCLTCVSVPVGTLVLDS